MYRLIPLVPFALIGVGLACWHYGILLYVLMGVSITWGLVIVLAFPLAGLIDWYDGAKAKHEAKKLAKQEANKHTYLKR